MILPYSYGLAPSSARNWHARFSRAIVIQVRAESDENDPVMIPVLIEALDCCRPDCMVYLEHSVPPSLSLCANNSLDKGAGSP